MRNLEVYKTDKYYVRGGVDKHLLTNVCLFACWSFAYPYLHLDSKGLGLHLVKTSMNAPDYHVTWHDV